jgi:MarR family 2-MHQ and catechol resistance regulon transcriptional repressor
MRRKTFLTYILFNIKLKAKGGVRWRESMEKETSFREVMLWVRLAMTFNVLYHEIKTELSKEKLTVPQLDIISCLDRSKGLPLSELAERLLVTGGNITGIIDRLERDGYVYRERDKKDRRIVRALLTEKGFDLYKSFLPRYKEVMRKINSVLTTEERHQLQRLLKKLGQGIKKQ